MSFHVPNYCRITDHHILASSESDGNNGAFRIINGPENGWKLYIIASDGSDDSVPEGKDWEHISIHAYKNGKMRTPTWKEMQFCKDLFWDEEDIAIQYHPRKSNYINMHPNVLHIWRLRGFELPEPPSVLVGYNIEK